jgi:hypothetical protein
MPASPSGADMLQLLGPFGRWPDRVRPLPVAEINDCWRKSVSCHDRALHRSMP